MAGNGRGGGMSPGRGGVGSPARWPARGRADATFCQGRGEHSDWWWCGAGGKGGGVAPAGKGGGVTGGADRADKLKTCELI
jgi:hypothetical protein